MSSEIQVRRGEKMDIEEARADISQGKFALLLSRPPADDVEGQYVYSGWTQCPGCGQVGWSVGLDSTRANTILCGACGCSFRA
jgi:hypothetical protein